MDVGDAVRMSKRSERRAKTITTHRDTNDNAALPHVDYFLM
jgi:hypothetical protein